LKAELRCARHLGREFHALFIGDLPIFTGAWPAIAGFEITSGQQLHSGLVIQSNGAEEGKVLRGDGLGFLHDAASFWRGVNLVLLKRF